jgi:hypothetical protein
VSGIQFGINGNSEPFENSVEPELRNREDFVKKLENLSRSLRSPVSFRCSHGKWDTETIGRKKTDEIINAVFGQERNKCDSFVEYTKYASQDAAQESEDKRLALLEAKKAHRLAIAAIIISLIGTLIASGSLVVAYLAYLQS